MRIVVFDYDTFEPLTALNVPAKELKLMQSKRPLVLLGVRPSSTIDSFAQLQKTIASGPQPEELDKLGIVKAKIFCEKITRNVRSKDNPKELIRTSDYLYFTDTPEEVLLIQATTLPGQTKHFDF